MLPIHRQGAVRREDEVLRRIMASTLFTADLAGPSRAAARRWGLPEGAAVEWAAGGVEAPAVAVRSALAGQTRVYLLVIDTPEETAIGGERSAVEAFVRDLGARCHPIAAPSAVHREVEDAYRALHLFGDTVPPPGVRFYSGAWGRSYDVEPRSAAEAILAAASGPIDSPAVVRRAYEDGVRTFVEVGPGASTSRRVDSILAGRPHLARSACVPGRDPAGTLLRLLGSLHAERFAVDLSALYGEGAPAEVAPCEGGILVPKGGEPFAILSPSPRPARPAPQRTRSTCDSPRRDRASSRARPPPSLRRRSGSSTPSSTAGSASSSRSAGSGALGPEFAAVDLHPTRVRLPGEPLMLVDGVVEGEARSMTHGRVVTEHDVLPGAWYLDHDRIPTAIAVEAGQADLFLSGYLGIDFGTLGLAVYRLLDAVVTFHRGLPAPGSTIR